MPEGQGLATCFIYGQSIATIRKTNKFLRFGQTGMFTNSETDKPGKIDVSLHQKSINFPFQEVSTFHSKRYQFFVRRSINFGFKEVSILKRKSLIINGFRGMSSIIFGSREVSTFHSKKYQFRT